MMTATIPGWTPELERQLKEVLFRFLEEVHSTKAALYLLAEDGSYLLVTQYGFGRRDQLVAEFDGQHPMVLLARKLRNNPRGFNRPQELPDLAEYLHGAGTARMLVTPLYGGSRLVGLVDARDKGRKAEFTNADERAASQIASTFLELLDRDQLYADLREESAAPVAQPEKPAIEAPVVRSLGGFPSSALNELRRDFRLALDIHGVEGIVWTVGDSDSAHTVLEAAVPVGQDEVQAAREHHKALLVGSGAKKPGRWTVDVSALEDRDAEGREVATGDVLLVDGDWRLAVSVLGPRGSQAAQVVLEQLRTSVARLRKTAVCERRWRGLARKLLTPGEQTHTELATHSEHVSRLAWRMAAFLGEEPETVELAAVAGWLHDVGMRELDYSRLYRHPSPGPDERRTYTRHTLVGERLLREAGLDDVATVVRHHHERWDGTGRPDKLAAEAIPLLSRLVHVAEVFDTLTSDDSYRRPVARSRALSIIRSDSGTQFDPEMVSALERVVR